MTEPDFGGIPPVGVDAWIVVTRKGERTYAMVNLQGGSVSSRWPVTSRREVDDIAARYGIPRGEIHITAGSFPAE